MQPAALALLLAPLPGIAPAAAGGSAKERLAAVRAQIAELVSQRVFKGSATVAPGDVICMHGAISGVRG
jgi:hypothetical protein